MIKVFLSWSDDLTGFVAEQFYQRLRAVSGGKVEPFLSRNMLPGERPIQAIQNELRDSNLGLLFLTRDQLNPPWVLFEAGALAKSPEGSTVIPITIGFPPGVLEPPLQIFQQGVSVDNEDGVRQVFTVICDRANADHASLDTGFSKWFSNLQVDVRARLSKSLSGGSSWDLVKTTKLAEVTEGSPFEAKDAFRIATQQLVFVGQNLFSLVGKQRPIQDSWFWRESLKFLKGMRETDKEVQLVPHTRKLDLMMIAPDEPHLKEAWGRSIGDEQGFQDHLDICVSALRDFMRLAEGEGLGGDVRIKLAEFIPLSLTFVDPGSIQGKLFLRPFTRGDRPHDRPIVLITRQGNPRAFDFYWTRHDADFNGGLYTRDL